MTRNEFARTVLLAEKLREASFNHLTQQYSLTYGEATRKAVLAHAHSEDWVLPIELLIRLAWNDIQDWAGIHQDGRGRKSPGRKSYVPFQHGRPRTRGGK